MFTPSLSRHRRRWITAVVALAAVGLLAACGSDDAGSAAATTSPTTSASAVTTSSAAATSSTTASSTTAASTTAAPTTFAPTTTPRPRTVAHAAGSTVIPPGVERIVVLDQAAALDALALGVEPAVAFAGFGPQPPLDEIIASHPDIAVEPYAVLAPSIETVAAAHPDLILASGHPTTISTYDAYSAVAPTVIIPYDADWHDQLAVAADALDRQTRGAEVADVIEAAVTDLRDAVTANGLTGTTVSVLGARGGNAYAFPASGLPGQLLADIGAGRPPAEQAPASGPVPLIPFSIETLGDHDADVLILIDSAATDTRDVIVASPLYPTLSAVAAGHAYTVDGDMWLGATPFSALWITQDLTSILVDGRAPDDLGTALDRWHALAA